MLTDHDDTINQKGALENVIFSVGSVDTESEKILLKSKPSLTLGHAVHMAVYDYVEKIVIIRP